MAEERRNYSRIVAMIYALLPYTLLKQKLFFRWKKPPVGLPDFLCIGAQKAGTTWLYHQLERHPDVCMAKPKEVHYFDWFFFRSLRWYINHFTCNNGKLRGEVTPGYSVIETGRVRFMKRIMPDVKIILLLRDPRDRAWSSARFHFGKELGRDLSQVKDEEFIAHFNQSWVKQRGDYAGILAKWSGVFPKEQMLVLLYEDISRDPQRVLSKVAAFLGVNEFPETDNSRYNESKAMDMPESVRKHLNEKFAPMIARLSQNTDIDLTQWKDYNRA